MPFRGRNKDKQRRAMFAKRTTNAQYKKSLKKLAPFADADRDGVRNIDDCRPFDRKRQDAQVYLEPSKKDIEKNISRYKNIGLAAKNAAENVARDLKMAAAAEAFHLEGVKDKTFIGKPKHNRVEDFGKTLDHEEIHNLLGENYKLLGLTKEEGNKASTGFDNIYVKKAISGNKLLNPKTADLISLKLRRQIDRAHILKPNHFEEIYEEVEKKGLKFKADEFINKIKFKDKLYDYLKTTGASTSYEDEERLHKLYDNKAIKAETKLEEDWLKFLK